MRPNHEDHETLRLLLARKDLSDENAEFLESLRQWQGPWTEKQQWYFDHLCWIIYE